jgi:glycine/D-amino acid oxidase-like deaminating enzyme
MRTRADVVVVGAGILGCAVAAEVASQGASVLLAERDQIAAGASGRNHGLIFRPEDSELDELYRRSLDMYRELAAGSPLDVALDHQPMGLLIVVTEEAQWAAAEREALAAVEGGIAIERLGPEGLREAEPALSEGHLGGFWIRDGIRLDPAALTLALAYAAREAGAEICCHTDVKQILVRNGVVRGVATDRGTVWAGTVVVAAGPWTAKVVRSALPPGRELPIGGIRGWLLLTESRPGLMHHLVESAGWHLAPGGPGGGQVTVGDHAEGRGARPDVGSLIQQNPGGHILLGGSRAGSLREDPQGGEVTAEIARGGAALVPALSQIPLVASWSGVRPTSPDGRPLIGWIPDVEGLMVVSGHGGQGVTLGAASARLAAQLLLGETPFLAPGPFDPNRFSLLGSGD